MSRNSPLFMFSWGWTVELPHTVCTSTAIRVKLNSSVCVKPDQFTTFLKHNYCAFHSIITFAFGFWTYKVADHQFPWILGDLFNFCNFKVHQKLKSWHRTWTTWHGRRKGKERKHWEMCQNLACSPAFYIYIKSRAKLRIEKLVTDPGVKGKWTHSPCTHKACLSGFKQVFWPVQRGNRDTFSVSVPCIFTAVTHFNHRFKTLSHSLKKVLKSSVMLHEFVLI